jgi:hypothetical protein
MTNDKPPVAPKEGQASPTLSVEQIEELRLKAFKTNDEEDIAAYFQATHKWFSDRHYRESALRTELEAFIKLADAACDYADKHCRWFDISTAPKDGTKILVTGPDTNGGVYMDVCAWPENWTGKWPVAYMAYAAGEPTHWMPAPPPPTNPPLPAVFTELGQALEKIKGAG